MKRVDWQSMDMDKIVSLIVEHNAGIDVSTELKRRIRGKLMAMKPADLWKHIHNVYHGELYEPEVYQVDAIELKRRELAVKKPREVYKAPKHIDIPVTGKEYQNLREEAETVLYGKNCTINVFVVEDGLVVLVEQDYGDKMRRYAKRHYPTINIQVVESER